MMLLIILTHNRPPGQELGTSETRVQGRWQEPLKLEIYLILFKFIHLTLIYFSFIHISSNILVAVAAMVADMVADLDVNMVADMAYDIWRWTRWPTRWPTWGQKN